MIHESKQEKGESLANIQEWRVAEYLLQQRGISLVLAARLVLEGLEATDNVGKEEIDAMRIRRIIQLGSESYRRSNHTVTFRELMECVLLNKGYRRERTLREISQYYRRIVRKHPEWESLSIAEISSENCKELIFGEFRTVAVQRKARAILHSLFAFAVKRNWCKENPLRSIELPPCKEHRISALSIHQVRKLLTICLQKKHLPCAATVGILLWAGVRPSEMERLQWKNVRFEDRVITIPAAHAKTGGARQVTLQPVLIRWLYKTSEYRMPDAKIVPPSWYNRWRELRRDAGFLQWEADILRHTFASYHLKYFRNLQELQIDMGHGSTDLLRTRYISMENVTRTAAKEFWHLSVKSLQDAAVAQLA